MRNALVGVVVLVAVALPIAGWAQRPATMKPGLRVPLEIITYQADMTIVGKVIEIGPPRKMRLKIPGDSYATSGMYQKLTVKVQKVLSKGAARVEPRPKTGVPTSAGTAVGVAKEDPNRLEVYARWVPQHNLWSVIDPQPGQKYILVLYRVPLTRTYYLPYNANNRFQATAGMIEKFASAGDVDKWPWGKAVDGLQLAVFASSPVLIPRQSPAFVRGVMAVRNTSDKDIYISLDPSDRPIALTGSGPDGKTAADEFYSGDKKLRPGASADVRVPAGRIIFVTPSGITEFATSWRLPLTPGKWKLQATYASRREKGAGDKAMWTGELRSGEVEVEARSVTHTQSATQASSTAADGK